MRSNTGTKPNYYVYVRSKTNQFPPLYSGPPVYLYDGHSEEKSGALTNLAIMMIETVKGTCELAFYNADAQGVRHYENGILQE